MSGGSCDRPGIVIHLAFRLRSDQHAKLFSFLKDALPLYQHPTGIRIRLLQDANDPESFLEVVEYLNRETHELDQVRCEHHPIMKRLLKEWRDIVGEVRVTTFADCTLLVKE